MSKAVVSQNVLKPGPRSEEGYMTRMKRLEFLIHVRSVKRSHTYSQDAINGHGRLHSSSTVGFACGGSIYDTGRVFRGATTSRD